MSGYCPYYADTLGRSQTEAGADKTLDRYIVDYLLRTGRMQAAKALAQHQGIEVSLNQSSHSFFPGLTVRLGLRRYQALRRAHTDRKGFSGETVGGRGAGMVR